jgi:hypothetical protein
VGNISDIAADFKASATGSDLHKHTCVDRDATRLRGEAPKGRPLALGSVMSRLARCHAIAWIATVAVDHMGNVQTSIFTKSGIERAMDTTRIGLQTIPYCNLLSLDLENAVNIISHLSFLVELCKRPDLHPIIPLVEIIYSRGSNVYCFNLSDASLWYGTV